MFLKVKNIIALFYSQKLYTNFKPVWIRYSFTLIHPWNGSHAKHTNKYRKFRWFPLANSKLPYYSALPRIFCIHFHRCCYLSVYMSVCECVCVCVCGVCICSATAKPSVSWNDVRDLCKYTTQRCCVEGIKY